MQALVCPNCGAPIDAPADPDQRVVTCGFCKRSFERDAPGPGGARAPEPAAAPPPPPETPLGSPPGPTAKVAPLVLVGLLVALGVAVGVSKKMPTGPGAVVHEEPPASVSAAVSAPATHVLSPAASASPGADPARLARGPVTITWRGRVSTATGAAPSAGSPCTITTTVSSDDGGERAALDQLTVQCGGQLLHDSSASLNGMANLRFGLDEVPVAGEVRVYEYAMKRDDVGSRSGPRTQVSLSTPDGVLEVFRDTAPSFRVQAKIDPLSAPRQGLPLLAESVPAFDEVVLRAAKATHVEGAPPFAAASCALAVSPGFAAGEACRVVVRCGGQVVYGAGSHGFVACEVASRAPRSFVDAKPTPVDGDPEVDGDLEAGTLSLGDTSKSGATYRVTFALSAQNAPR